MYFLTVMCFINLIMHKIRPKHFQCKQKWIYVIKDKNDKVKFVDFNIAYWEKLQEKIRNL